MVGGAGPGVPEGQPGPNGRAHVREGAPVEIAWLDRSGVIVGVNEAWVEFCDGNGGVRAACGVGASYLAACDAAGDAISARVGHAIRRACDGDLTSPVTFTIPCDSETLVRWFGVSVYPRHDDAGTPRGATVALTPQDEPLTGSAGGIIDTGAVWQLIERAPDGLVVVDRDGLIVYSNRQLERISGHRREDLVGHPIDLLVPNEARDRHHLLEEAYWAAPRSRPMGAGNDLRIQHRDGTTSPIEVSLAPVRIGGVLMTVASVRDVSRQRSEDLARRRLLALLDLVPDAVYVVDATSTRIEYANAGAVAMLGWSHDELTGMTMAELSLGSSNGRPPGLLEEHLRAGEGLRHEVHVRRHAKDGTLVACDSRGQVVHADRTGGKVVIVDRDARERLAAERAGARRVQLAAVVSEVRAMVLSDATPETIHGRLVERTAALLEAENASLVLRHSSDDFETLAATGPAAKLHLDGTVVLDAPTLDEWTTGEQALSVDEPPPRMPRRLRELVGPGAIVSFALPPSGRGVLTTFRATGRERFGPEDVDLLADLARQVSTVLALGRARAAQHRLALLEDRQRIARDLHDTVVQDVISVGMQLGMTDGIAVEARDDLLDAVEQVLRRLRAIVFDARAPVTTGATGDAIRATVAEATRSLGHPPTLTVEGPIDGLEPMIVAHLVPTLREALSNVARHARATATQVSVIVDGEAVSLTVEDDGVGPAGRDRAGTGLANASDRANLLSGTSEVTARSDGGTRLRWTARRP